MSVKSSIILYRFNKKWRSINKHNRTNVSNLFNYQQVEVGKGTYGNLYVLSHGTDSKLKIGHYCSIAPKVSFVLQSDHCLHRFSTFPFKVMGGVSKYEAISKGDIIIDDDVWIGIGSTILSGVHIERGAVIGAGSIITHDIPPYAVVVGSPGRVIGYRFDPKIIEILMHIDYANIDIEDVINCPFDLYQMIDSVETAENIVKNINKK